MKKRVVLICLTLFISFLILASKSAFKKNISKVQLDPLIKQVDMSAFENKKNKKG